MNIEILSADIQTNDSHIFAFTRPVKQYIVGFSKCFMQFPHLDHHIKEITIDLTNSSLKNNEVYVKPELRMNDDSKHRESEESNITVVVLAEVGDGNPDVALINGIKKDEINSIPPDKTDAIVKPILTCTSVCYNDTDHHVYQYFSTIKPVFESNNFQLKGQSVVQDHGEHSGNGVIIGGVFVSSKGNKDVMIADFNSEQIGGNGQVCFGNAINGIDYSSYEMGCFINGYQLSYDGEIDHHVRKIEISAEFSAKSIEIHDDKICAGLNLKALLSDNDNNQFDIPHNNITGFVIAFKKNN